MIIKINLNNMTLVLLSLLIIVILYFAVAFSPIRICAICAAVSLTWAGLLIGYFLGWHQNLLWIGILMGGSVVGLMYRTQAYFQKKEFSGRSLSAFWLIRIGIIVLGFLGVYLLLIKDWDKLILEIIAVVIFGFLALFFVKPVKKDRNLNNKAAQSFKDKLEHCCD